MKNKVKAKPTPARAIKAVARELVALAVERYARDGWEDFPEIGENDWDRVVEKAQKLAPWPRPTDFIEAYGVLEARAEHTEQ